MAGIKRKNAPPARHEPTLKSKKIKVDKATAKQPTSKLTTRPKTLKKQVKPVAESDELVESDTTEDSNGFYGFSADKSTGSGGDESGSGFDSEVEDAESGKPPKERLDGKKVHKGLGTGGQRPSTLEGLNATSSREAHAKQKALAKERKAAKPNADVIERLMGLWEKMRQKTNVTPEERKDLIDKTFEIITGRIKDFVFKHDAVRVIQSALKYTRSMDQRRIVARELKGEFKGLAEGKYAKFLVAKLLENGDSEIRDMVISEFYGHVRRLINHPEASWILDDTYRQVATPEQKARLLREWYGPEFAIKGLDSQASTTADLSTILEQSPEKRKPIMDYLEVQINQLIQKKQSGFTILHDAMLQYFLTCKPGTSEASDFLEHLRPDATLKEGEEADNVDLLKNLAFTKPGSRLVSLALAYGTAKDRKIILKPYKDTIEMMAYDANAHHILLAALAVIDDTKLSSKSIFGELLPANDTLSEKVLNLTQDVRARTVLLYPFAADSKWLLDEETRERLSEIYTVRQVTSKKDTNVRLSEITKNIESQLLTAISSRTSDLATSSFGLQFLGEVLIGAPEVEPAKRKAALTEVARLSRQILDSSDKTMSQAKNMLKTLVQGGKFDPTTKKVVAIDPPLGFADMFWEQIKGDVVKWATGQGSFVVVSLTETEGFDKKNEVLNALKSARKELVAAASPAPDGAAAKQKKGKGGKNALGKGGNAGARILLEKI